MCIINHLKISSRNIVIYHLKMIARHSTPRDFFTKNSVRFSYFLLLTLRTMPWRRSLGQALGRVSIFLVRKDRNRRLSKWKSSSFQNEYHLYHLSFRKDSHTSRNEHRFQNDSRNYNHHYLETQNILNFSWRSAWWDKPSVYLEYAPSLVTTRTQYHIPIQWIGPPLNCGTARIFITD